MSVFDGIIKGSGSIFLGSIGGNRFAVPAIDKITNALVGVTYAHHEIHGQRSFTAYYTITTAATNAHRTGLYIKTGTKRRFHCIFSFSASTAASFSICEAPTIAANTGSHGVVAYNRDRASVIASECYDNATAPAAGKFTTLTEAQIAGDGTWAVGTVIRTEPLEVGSGPKPAGGVGRGTEEYILKSNTAYVALITNTAASANTHHVLIDWYEHKHD